jgi:Domain of unknown function (DUF4123)
MESLIHTAAVYQKSDASMMKTHDIATFSAVADQHGAWRWYAIADSAQDKSLPAALCKDGAQHRCLLDAPVNSPLAKEAPHLVQLNSPSTNDPAWQWIARNAYSLPCVSVIASNLYFDALFAHLKPFTEVLLPDGDDMFFAFWDPAILATLVGQVDDATLYVKGPVLSAPQRAQLTNGLTGWWYWDRDGALHSIATGHTPTEILDLPLQLTQQQVDELVEASVPDHVLNHIELNQPQLLRDYKPAQRYGLVRTHLLNAKQIKLDAMSDMVNYVCAALIYQEQFQINSDIVALLDRVKQGELLLNQALEQMP